MPTILLFKTYAIYPFTLHFLFLFCWPYSQLLSALHGFCSCCSFKYPKNYMQLEVQLTALRLTGLKEIEHFIVFVGEPKRRSFSSALSSVFRRAAPQTIRESQLEGSVPRPATYRWVMVVTLFYALSHYNMFQFFLIKIDQLSECSCVLDTWLVFWWYLVFYLR
jgi:hypothetical protein